MIANVILIDPDCVHYCIVESTFNLMAHGPGDSTGPTLSKVSVKIIPSFCDTDSVTIPFEA